jgi:hypothetical protein
MDIKKKKKILLKKEQFYLDNINPSLNSCKIANSILGIKRDEMFSINLSKSRRGKKIRSPIKINNTIRTITTETRSKISLRNKGVSVQIFDGADNLLYEFPTIRSTAKFFGVNPKTISMIFKTGKSFDGLTYKFKVKENKT